jgi:hypothetical protein
VVLTRHRKCAAQPLHRRRSEAAVKGYKHDRVEVGGMPVRFMRKLALTSKPTPVVLTRGWPRTLWHWSKVIVPPDR